MAELVIPKIQLNDWSEAIEAANGAEKQLLVYQARAANTLNAIDDFEATPRRLAWLNLWNQVHSTIEGARAALRRKSLYTLEILARASDECSLHIFTVIEPQNRLLKLESSELRTSVSESAKQNATQESLNRLNAYAAWCFWNDKQHYDKMLDNRNIGPAWDDSIKEELAERRAEEGKEKQQLLDALFGEINIEDPEELNRRRRAHEEQLWNDLQRAESWLDHPELEPWFERLESSAKAKNWINSFFELVDETQDSVFQRMLSMDVAFGYALYQRRSMILHGSTMEGMLAMDDERIVPKLTGLDRDVENVANEIGTTCNHNMALLHALRNQVWPDAAETDSA